MAETTTNTETVIKVPPDVDSALQAPKQKRELPAWVPWLIALMSFAVALVSLLFGPALLNRPSIEVQTGTVDVGLAPDFRLRLVTNQFWMQIPAQAKAMKAEYEKALVKFGMPSEKIPGLLSQWEDPGAMGEQKKTNAVDVPLQPNEKHILMNALSVAQMAVTGLMTKMMNVPDKVSFFQVANRGRAEATNVRITIRVPGALSDHAAESDSKIASENMDGNSVTIELPTLAPGATVEGRVWYIGGESWSVYKPGITVAYQGGSFRAPLADGWVKPDEVVQRQ